ncbi:MAG TPA: acetyl-coenzyme A synthetase N-terminal domain-containing protein, partial [Isosphaeraceae bacterium]|nr:acetyl-coenzyme A synthetase N-terminal domain-containing protein [Isosphaeraceae bacterium]
MPDSIAWSPPPELAERSNVGQFMRRHGIADYHELLRRSTEDIAWFWQAVVEDLGIEFYEPYRQVVDASSGIPWARWFVGGKINIVQNCVDKHVQSSRRDKLAVIGETESGDVRSLT